MEQSLEHGFNSVFVRTFRSGVQPIELSSALKNELDTHTQIVARDRILVPNDFVIKLAPDDYDRLAELGTTLTDDLVEVVQQHAMQQGYQFIGGIQVALDRDTHLAVGDPRIASRSIKTQVVWVPTAEFNGRTEHLAKGHTVFGRSSTSDIQIQDAGISKQHAAVQWDGVRAILTDLGSTNGTFVDGQRITAPVELPREANLRLGRTELHFKLHPMTARGTQRS